MRDYPTLNVQTQIKVKEHIVVRKNLDLYINEH